MSGNASRKSRRTGAIAIATGTVAGTGFTAAGELFGACNCADGTGRPDDRLQQGFSLAATCMAVAGMFINVGQHSCGAASVLVQHADSGSAAAGMTTSAIASITATT